MKDPDKTSFSIVFLLVVAALASATRILLFRLSSVLLKSVRDMYCLLFCCSSTRWSETTISNCFADRRRQLAFPKEVSIAIYTKVPHRCTLSSRYLRVGSTPMEEARSSVHTHVRIHVGSGRTKGCANSVENVFDDDDLELMGGYLDLD